MIWLVVMEKDGRVLVKLVTVRIGRWVWYTIVNMLLNPSPPPLRRHSSGHQLDDVNISGTPDLRILSKKNLCHVRYFLKQF